MSVIVMCVSFCSYPLLNISLPGNKPQQLVVKASEFTVPLKINLEGPEWPRWYKDAPAIYVQQIVVKSAVVPWSSDLILTDAFRGPFSQVYEVLDIIKNANR